MENIVRNGFVGLAIGAVFAAIVFFIGDAVSGPLEAEPVGEISIGPVVTNTIAGGIAGMIIAAIASRFGRPRQIFTVVCVVLLVVYAIPPFVQAETVETAVWLNVMHIGAAVPILGRLRPALPEIKGGPVADD